MTDKIDSTAQLIIDEQKKIVNLERKLKIALETFESISQFQGDKITRVIQALVVIAKEQIELMGK